MGIANAHRETSHSAYLEIEDNGQLRDMKRKVFRCLSENPPLTGREVDERLGGLLGGGAWKRLSELRDAGFVVEVGKRKCSVTGFTAIVWATKTQVPEGFQPPRKGKMTTLFKLRKSPRPPQCDATRCDEEGANNLTGEMWRRPTVRLCARHTSMVLAFQDKHPDYVPDGEEQTPEPLPTSVTALVPAGITLANQTVLGAWVERVRGIAAELPGLLAEGTSVLEYAKEYVIGTHAELVEASAFLLEVKSTNNAIASKKKEITAPLSGALAKVRELLKPTEQVWVDAEAILRAKTEAAALHEAERNRLAMQAASEAHAGGQDVSGALARLTTSSDLEGVTFKVFWKAIVEDVSLLPNEFVVRIPNQLKLKEHCAKAGDSEPEPIAGVRFEKDATSRVQSKKT